ncbi:MAG: hypothetical protein OYK82_07655 [Gammaproteobacteria bacterium]|nr:hypothetical protein [Gammaproteobacteria bacterium]
MADPPTEGRARPRAPETHPRHDLDEDDELDGESWADEVWDEDREDEPEGGGEGRDAEE